MRPSPGRGTSRSDTAPCGWSTSGWAARSSGCSGGSAGCPWRTTMLADVPMVFILVGITAYTVLSGADFAAGRVPVGNARGDEVTSWLNPVSVLAGVLAVAFSGYLAAVYLAADAQRLAERALVHDFRIRALASGVVAGALALAGLLVIRVSAGSLWHGLTSGLGLALVIVSALAGVVTMVLVFLGRFGPARASAALAVAAVIAGWAAAQSPLVLPGLTVAEAAAGRSTLIATIVGVAVGAVVLVPSLGVLYALVLRGRLDTSVVSDSVAADSGEVPRAVGRRSPRVSLAAGFAVVTLVA